MKISSANIQTNAGGYVPEGLYRARCIGTKFVSANSSKQPMTTLKCEVIEPETIEVNGETVTVAGRNFDMFLIHNVNKTGWASQEQVMRFCENLKIDTGVDANGEKEYDTELHKEYFHGMEFDIALHSEEDVKRYQPKPGQKVGDPILDADGQKISTGWRIACNPDDVGPNCRPSKNEEVANQPY